MLEQTLANYPGTIILVSHDRRFLDNVVTEVLAPEGNGLWREYVGGYEDWLRQRPKTTDEARADKAPKAEKAAPKPRQRTQKVKLSYKETRELESLPGRIEALEAEQSALVEKMSGAGYHGLPVEELRADAERMKAIDEEMAAGFARWEELEAKQREAQGE